MSAEGIINLINPLERTRDKLHNSIHETNLEEFKRPIVIESLLPLSKSNNLCLSNNNLKAIVKKKTILLLFLAIFFANK